jgi:hypothetical protein
MTILQVDVTYGNFMNSWEDESGTAFLSLQGTGILLDAMDNLYIWTYYLLGPAI